MRLSDIKVGDIIHYDRAPVRVIKEKSNYSSMFELKLSDLAEYWNDDFTDKSGDSNMDIVKVERTTVEVIWTQD
jgi:intein/homing endonuclease